MLAVATTAAVLVGGSAAYTTDANQTESQTAGPKQTMGGVKLDSAVFQIPHPEKKHKGGEDTFLISSNGSVLGVFDGVGGWADSGVDPREYAVKLSEGAQEATDKKHMEDPVDVMRYAAAHARSTTGSSTACIVALKENDLISANLGDSGFMLIRFGSGDVKDVQYYKTKEQQYSFNFPYQLGRSSSNKAEDSDVVQIPLEHGDIIVLGTDGLFDNLDEKVIIQLVWKAVKSNTDKSFNVANLARSIAEEAFKVSEDPRAKTPFAIASNYRWMGGKQDDITVLVSRVVGTSPASSAPGKPATTASQSGQATITTNSNSYSKVDFKRATINSLSTSGVSNSNFDSDEEFETQETAQGMSFLQRIFNLRPWTSSPAKL
jgi:protein phosphatase PTC7